MNQPSDNLSTTSGLESLSAKALLRLNFWCDQYESAWRQQADVDLAEFLSRVPSEERDHLAGELVLIDIEIRCQRSLPISIDGYRSIAQDLPREWLEAQVARRQTAKSSTNTLDLQPGHQLGDYTIVSRLGAGGMGIVYRAEHRLMKRQVALKVIEHQSTLSKLAKRRFEREVRAAAQLAHPNIVVAFDARQFDDWIYLVTELIEGENLDNLVGRVGPLTSAVALNYALQAARGLEYAHQQGIIHRDIKPANLLVDSQQHIKILDLGLARWLDDSTGDADAASLTSSFQMLGTAPFMSPEQTRSAASADQRSDIYSLGCTLFFMLTGQTPYHGLSRIDVCLAHLNAPVPSLCEIDSSIPKALDELTQTWMAKDPRHRPQSMTEAIRQLEVLLKPKAKAVSPPPSLTPTSSAPSFKRESSVEPEPSARNTPLLKLPSSSSLISRRNLLLATTSISAVTLTALGVNRWFWNGTDSPPRGRQRIADLNAPGLRLQGNGYFDVADFRVPVQDNMAIEALLHPGMNRGPANIVTWTGPRSFVLFCDQTPHWGIAYFDGSTPRLVATDDPTERSGLHLISAVWDGQSLQIFVNGSRVASSQLTFQLVPAQPRLYIGGIPDGVILPSQGTRFYNGEIRAVRILQSQQRLELATRPSELAVTPQTLALFDFGHVQTRPNNGQLSDLTGRWRGNMNWVAGS